MSVLTFLACLLVTAIASPVNQIPDYVNTFAPIRFLYSQEAYLPSDIGSQLLHTTPVSNQAIPGSWTLDNLNSLGSDVFLTSNEPIQTLPSWFRGTPGKNGAVIVVNKGEYVDAFYFSFYAYNQGNTVKVLGISLGEFGDHVGDWEHTMIRFKDGQPQAIWLSQHQSGEAFTYDAMEKIGARPVIYIGNGTHANWATTGPHDHVIPGFTTGDDGLITDFTDKGPMVDYNPYSYTYDGTTFVGDGPTAWLNFGGAWGNKALPKDAPGQKDLFGQLKFTDGPTGPKSKNLMRKQVCDVADNGVCIIRPILTS